MSIRTPFASVALTIALAGCSPGELDPALEGKPSTQTTLERPEECTPLGVESLADFDKNFIVPKCGQAKCHGPMSVFPPRNLDMPGMIRTNLVGKKATLNCKEDYYIKTGTGWKDSYMLHKVEATGESLPCPTPTDKPDSGGTRMPNKMDMPTIVGDRLSEGELKCFSWWVQSLATAK